MSYICGIIKANKDMTSKYDTNWIMKTAQGIFELTVKYNSRFSMEKAIARATERAQSLIEALADPKCMIDEHDHIIKVYDFKNVQSLDSIYGCQVYCGD